MALLTIGMPLYRNAATLERTVRAIQAQTFTDFQVIMSDDISPDDTVAVAERLIAGDARFTLVRQPKNLNYGNFRYVLNAADTPFFVFLSGDDWWEPTFLERCLEVLRDEGVVCATPKIKFIDDADGRLSYGTLTITGTMEERFIKYLDNIEDACRLYGVYRTEVAQACFPPDNHYSYDTSFSGLTTLYGDHVELPEVLMYREQTQEEKYYTYVRRDAQTWLQKFFPFLGNMTCMMRDPRVRHIPGVRRRMWAILLNTHLIYVARFHPTYSRVVRPLLVPVVWRLCAAVARKKVKLHRPGEAPRSEPAWGG